MPNPDLLAAALAHAARAWHVFPLRPDNRIPPMRMRRGGPRSPTGAPPTGATAPTRAAARQAGTSGGRNAPPPTPTASAARGQRAPTAWDRVRPVRSAGGRPGRAQAPRRHAARRVGRGARRRGRARRARRPARRPVEPTYTVTTGRGGSHLYYQFPEDGPELRNTAGDRGGLGWKVDTRAHRGYVVAAGSTVNGRPYTLALDCEPTPLPGWLASLLAPAERPAYRPTAVALPADRRGRYLAAARSPT
ncbi:hypothetical protein Van01_64890 [Micromonospora andamanensis]|uniref:DNA primase/polymerase bifunctional N-terminal domain-containing protein n=1 Tax=Micromonospora andamanensis TaxID=1287068 RepID=A0ABQ4I5W2_9ACTN|nr:hypothetical protein Van01_64890 [Micromonospora andamanensis]GIJ41994.1 hypothetical protein Vwe01_53190 [Micromonospora andamanensis]